MDEGRGGQGGLRSVKIATTTGMLAKYVTYRVYGYLVMRNASPLVTIWPELGSPSCAPISPSSRFQPHLMVAGFPILLGFPTRIQSPSVSVGHASPRSQEEVDCNHNHSIRIRTWNGFSIRLPRKPTGPLLRGTYCGGCIASHHIASHCIDQGLVASACKSDGGVLSFHGDGQSAHLTQGNAPQTSRRPLSTQSALFVI